MHRSHRVSNEEVQVLLVSASIQSVQNIETTLKQLNYQVSAFTTCDQAIAALRAKPDIYSLIILDMQKKSDGNIEMIRMIRMMEDLLEEIWRPILLMGSANNREDFVQGLNVGADAFILTPIDKDLIHAKVNAIVRMFLMRKKQLSKYLTIQHESLTDVLTGLPNRRHFNDILKKAITVSQRHQRALCVAYFDLDFFKQINDNHSHDAGDMVLKEVCKTLKKHLRNEDSIGRMGGEEFCICMPDTSLEEAKIPIERYRIAIESMALTYDNKPIQVTASFGLTQFKAFKHDVASLLAHADHALYESKKNGRNCVTALTFDFFQGKSCNKI